MNRNGIALAATVALFTATSAAAQDAADVDRERAAAERQRERVEAQRQEAEVRRVEAEQRAVSAETEMREAERQLEEAARRIAELSSRQLPAMAGNWSMEFGGRPVLGVTIGASDDDGPVKGVEILAVSPGGAAAEAGLRAGDVIASINKEDLAAASARDANQKLVDFMAGVKEGDVLDVGYLRNGKAGTARVEPHKLDVHAFAFGGPDQHFRFNMPVEPPDAPGMEFNRYFFVSGDGGWGDMEMVSLTKDLGRYFGTEEGMLVVRAPSDESLQLRDGDVIRSIGGRKPQSVNHAIRILGSYQPGETVEIDIMRDKKRQTLKVDVPDRRQGGARPFVVPGMEPEAPVAPAPAIAPVPAPQPTERT